MNMMKMKMKEKLLDELMEELDGQEAEKLKPVSKVEVMSVKAKPKGMMMDELVNEEEGEEIKPMDDEGSVSMGDEDELDEESLKKLLASYMK